MNKTKIFAFLQFIFYSLLKISFGFIIYLFIYVFFTQKIELNNNAIIIKKNELLYPELLNNENFEKFSLIGKFIIESDRPKIGYCDDLNHNLPSVYEFNFDDKDFYCVGGLINKFGKMASYNFISIYNKNNPIEPILILPNENEFVYNIEIKKFNSFSNLNVKIEYLLFVINKLEDERCTRIFILNKKFEIMHLEIRK